MFEKITGEEMEYMPQGDIEEFPTFGYSQSDYDTVTIILKIKLSGAVKWLGFGVDSSPTEIKGKATLGIILARHPQGLSLVNENSV